MTTNIPVLDHGYLKLVETWGSDERIVEAARVSTYKGFQGWGPKHTETCRILMARASVPGTACSCQHDTPGDEKLLRYLYEHKHMTPFEMAGMTIEVQAPIFVLREWHRHRTQCLAGETLINLVSPRGTTYKRTIQQLFILKHGGVIDTAPVRHRNGTSKHGTPVWREARRQHPWRTRILPNCQSRILRTFDEASQTYRFGMMRDVWESGNKEIWSLVTNRGSIKASATHPLLTSVGWAQMGDVRVGDLIATSGRVATSDRPIPPSLRAGIGVWTTMMRKRLIKPFDTCYICHGAFIFDQLELDHVIPVSVDLRLALDEDNLKPLCSSCHRRKINTEQPSRLGRSGLGLRWTRVTEQASRIAEAMTYDLEMTGPDHNYVANGLVVHNSYNELSARYTPLPDVNYVPTVERLLMTSGANKQAQSTGNALGMMQAEDFRRALETLYATAQTLYQLALNSGTPKELARLCIPVGRYSRMRASANLRNWLAFLTLRMDEAAQWEIRQYANAIGGFIAEAFPRTWELFAKSPTTTQQVVSRTGENVAGSGCNRYKTPLTNGMVQ